MLEDDATNVIRMVLAPLPPPAIAFSVKLPGKFVVIREFLKNRGYENHSRLMRAALIYFADAVEREENGIPDVIGPNRFRIPEHTSRIEALNLSTKGYSKS